MAPNAFSPSKNIPPLNGKNILITGGTGGLGRETVLSLASHSPRNIYFSGRSTISADKVIAEANTKNPGVAVTFLRCDLTSLHDVQQLAAMISTRVQSLDIVFANAGIMAAPPGLTKDGYEIHFATNHLGHALLVKLLTPLLERTAQTTGDVRVIWVSSIAYQLHPWCGLDFDTLQTTQSSISFVLPSWVRYAQSKLANILYAAEYARRHPTITSVPVHPGISKTELVTGLDFWSRMIVYIMNPFSISSPEQCAYNQQWAATAPRGSQEGQVESSVYYEPVGVRTKLVRGGNDAALARKLWDWTDVQLKAYTLEEKD